MAAAKPDSDSVFGALADRTRRLLLDRLFAENGQTLGSLCSRMRMTRQAVSKHLVILEQAGLITIHWHGREKLHYLNPLPIQELSSRWIAKFERERVQALHDLKLDLERSTQFMEKPDFLYRTFIATTPEKLWAALTTGEFMSQYWYGRRIRSDWKVGSPVQTIKPDGGVDWDGKVLVYEPPRRLSYTFQIIGFQKRSSRVVFEIEPHGDVVVLTLEHYDIEKDCLEAVSQAWPAFCSTIKSLLETGKPLKFPE